MKHAILVLIVLFLCLGCSRTIVAAPVIDSFESCVAAGYPALRTYPGQCRTPEGNVFIQKVPAESLEQLRTALPPIITFEDCLNSGYPVIESSPRRCIAGNRTFVEPKIIVDPKAQPTKLCVDQCGNGTCEEMVCMGEGCPCAETAQTCPADCKA